MTGNGLGDENLLITFMPVSCDQICMKSAMTVRLIMFGLNRSRYVTFLYLRSNSHISRISCISMETKGWFGSPFPWTFASTVWHSSQRSLRASHRGDSGRTNMPTFKNTAGII